MGVIVKIEVDADLLSTAQKLLDGTDEVRVVEQALREMIRRRSKVAALLELAGSNILREDYDYKALRAGGNGDY
ncbi:MAG: type II toxin-antitoxin system VapB family antitoxin [Hyphomicrobiaceae bacterium]|nr:type II toxin-antitoxin system VapB family antitoxin [Hyphomicrobiaceae bacterium]